ncbi:MAG: transcriptional regulator [Phycisphaerae bacterium]|nr:MAG: transcriptional regulator [Phycisphaerae bacterium]
MAFDRTVQVQRLLKIILLLQSNSNRWTADRLAKECRVSARTIFRDMRVLEKVGVPYFYDEENKCYSIRRDFYMPPVQLTLEESLSLVVLAEQIANTEQISCTKPALKAVEKIRGGLPSMLRESLQKITQHIHIRLAASSPPEGSQDVYNMIQTALNQRLAIRCRYESPNSNQKDSAETPFIFKPYVLHYDQRAWYTIGHHSLRDEIRCLKLSRFTMIEVTNIPYEIPKSFNLREHLGNAWRMIRGKPTYDVELIFDPSFAETVSDTHWHATQETDWNEDGSLVFRCRVDGLQEIIWWVLSMGPHCKVVKPPELARQVRSLSSQVIKLYSDSTD